MIATELREFDRHLTDVRGLSPTTRYSRVMRVRAFLLDLFGTRPIRLSKLGRMNVVSFMARHTANWKPSSKHIVVTLTPNIHDFLSFYRREPADVVPTPSRILLALDRSCPKSSA